MVVKKSLLRRELRVVIEKKIHLGCVNRSSGEWKMHFSVILSENDILK